MKITNIVLIREKKIKRLLEPIWLTWTRWVLKKLAFPFVKVWKILTKKKELCRNNWISVYSGFHKLNSIIAPASYFDNRLYIRFSLGWGQFFVHLPVRSKYDECEPPRYGFYFYSDSGKIPTSFVICKGRETKHFDMPWSLEWFRTSTLTRDKEWIHEKKGDRKEFWNKDKWKDILWYSEQPYTYHLKNGTVQNVTATIRVEEREWRPKWFMWTKIFSYIRRDIVIEFSSEVGEGTGSWKGGTTGCGYEIKRGETPVQTLRRMEREREL